MTHGHFSVIFCHPKSLLKYVPRITAGEGSVGFPQTVACLADPCALTANAVVLPDIRGAGRTARWRCRGRAGAGRGSPRVGVPWAQRRGTPGSRSLPRFRVSPINSGRASAQPGSLPSPSGESGHLGASVPRARRPGLTRRPRRPPPPHLGPAASYRRWVPRRHPSRVPGSGAVSPAPRKETGAPTHRGASLRFAQAPAAAAALPEPPHPARPDCSAGRGASPQSPPPPPPAKPAPGLLVRAAHPPLSQLGEPDRGAPQHKLCVSAPPRPPCAHTPPHHHLTSADGLSPEEMCAPFSASLKPALTTSVVPGGLRLLHSSLLRCLHRPGLKSEAELEGRGGSGAL